jgi:predicted nucleic acid-binding protein
MAKLIVDACVLIDAFQGDNPHRDSSTAFIEECVRANQLMTMPAHGWFEVWSNVKRISERDRKYLHPLISGKMELPIELIAIDEKFIQKYGNVVVPHLRGSDHIYMAIAFENGYELVTRDDQMLRVGREIGVRAFLPAEYSAILKRRSG